MKLGNALRAAAILLLALDQTVCVAASVPSITPDDLAVFRAVLSSGCRWEQSYNVVSDIPVTAKDQPIPSDWPSRPLWTKLARRVPSAVKWPHVDICAAYRVVDGITVDSTFARQTRDPPGWGPFYAKVPGAKGLIRVSLPAFTTDRRHAVVYLEATCNLLCGSGFYIELTRGKAGWKLSRRENAWIS